MAEASHTGTATVLLERDVTLSRLGEALDVARLGRGTVLFVGGEADVGKTSLARALCERAERETGVLTTL